MLYQPLASNSQDCKWALNILGATGFQELMMCLYFMTVIQVPLANQPQNYMCMQRESLFMGLLESCWELWAAVPSQVWIKHHRDSLSALKFQILIGYHFHDKYCNRLWALCYKTFSLSGITYFNGNVMSFKLLISKSTSPLCVHRYWNSFRWALF